MAKADRILLLIAIPLFALGLLNGVDLLFAVTAEPCPATNCYPWGAEGPGSDYWSYQSKPVYLAAGLTRLLAPTAALAIVAIGTRGAGTLSNLSRVCVMALLVMPVFLILAG